MKVWLHLELLCWDHDILDNQRRSSNCIYELCKPGVGGPQFLDFECDKRCLSPSKHILFHAGVDSVLHSVSVISNYL